MDEKKEDVEGHIEENEIGENEVRENEISESRVREDDVNENKVDESEINGRRVDESQVDESEIDEGDVDKSEISENRMISEDVRGEIGNLEVLEKRKKKILGLLKSKQLWVIGLLIVALILGIYIRSQPMLDHGGGVPGLWDVTTNTWTLGPDLDPWLFYRYANTIAEQGSMPKIDMMRNVPLGFNTSIETPLLPLMIVWLYYILNIFMNTSVMFAAVLFPVIMFALTIIVFFLFVREIFSGKTKGDEREGKENITKANIIALIATFFMIVIPIFLSRTIAGIPEKESAAFFFMFLAFYLFLKAWKSEKIKNAIILGALAGIATGAMGLVWGGVVYAFATISFSSLLAFIIGKVRKKEFLIYCSWTIAATIILVLFPSRYSLVGLITSINGMYITFFILLMHFILWHTPVSKTRISKRLSKINLPKNIISLIVSIVLGLLMISVFFGPGLIIDKVNGIIRTFINPTTGRWGVTVAENKQPYFREWSSGFGPYVKNIPLTFWLFFIGSVVLFKNMFSRIRKKDSWILTGFYILALFGLIFSRYSPSSLFNGENFISKLFYFGSWLLLLGFVAYYYIKDYKRGERGFREINFSSLFLFTLFTLTLISVRSAVRLVMVLGSIAPIFVGYLGVHSFERFRRAKDETLRIFLGAIVVILLIASLFAFFTFYKGVQAQAYGLVPSAYNHQWQKAMNWVREETPKDAVFSHWWDYGYWVQSIGERATSVDGGNAIVYWNYLMGRHVLTGDNQEDALEFLYNHETTHFLIDSSDIGKYTAFSSIGSNENYDRFSWIGTFILDEKQTRETKEEITLVYPGRTGLDEDLIIEENGEEILLPGQRTGIAFIMVPTKDITNPDSFNQPYVILFYQNRQHKVNLRYLSVHGEFIDFGSGIEACAYVFPTISQQGQGINSNPVGASIFLSPRLMRGMLAHIYILDDPLDKYHNFRLVHSEQSLVVDSLNMQGMNLPDFVYYGGVLGPIKIWEVDYIGNEKIKEEYLDTDPSKYLTWRL